MSIRETIDALTKGGCKIRDLTGIVDRNEYHYLGVGAYGDVYRGIWRGTSTDGEYPEIAVKVLRSTGIIERNAPAKRLKVRR